MRQGARVFGSVVEVRKRKEPAKVLKAIETVGDARIN